MHDHTAATLRFMAQIDEAYKRGYRFRIAELEAEAPIRNGVTVWYGMMPGKEAEAVVNDISDFFEKCAPNIKVRLAWGELRVVIE